MQADPSNEPCTTAGAPFKFKVTLALGDLLDLLPPPRLDDNRRVIMNQATWQNVFKRLAESLQAE
jgi:hypothetical protein